MLENGTILDGKYEILSKVGQGGMSVVYLALNRKAMKQWAIKEVRRDGVKDFEVVKQSLVAETDMLKKLSHPNLPDIVDIIEDEDSFFIVMDYIEGKPLSKRIEESGAQPEDYVIEWAKQLCDVLDYLHTRQPAIIYRDMKPSNVMLRPDATADNPYGTVCLIDFGTAREYKGTNIQDTTCLGTIGYAAPEQFGGQGETDARTDIYCLGATLYHLVTGHSPAEPPYEMHPIRYWDESLSPGLEAIILKCIQKNPNDRFQTCAELKYALEHLEENTREYKVKQQKRYNLFLTCVIATILFFAVGLTGTILSNTNVKSQYEYYVSKAANETGADAAADYKKAFDTKYMGADPSEMADAFRGYLNALAENDETTTITEAELNEFKSAIGVADSSREDKYIEKIGRNLDAYVMLNYDIGLKLMGYTDGSETVQNNAARTWFVKAYTDNSGKEIDASRLSDSVAITDYNNAKVLDDMITCWTKIQNADRDQDIIGETQNFDEVYEAIQTAVDSVYNQAFDDGVKLKVYDILASFLADNSHVKMLNNTNRGLAASTWQQVVNDLNSMTNLKTGGQETLKEEILSQSAIISENLS